MAIKSVILVSIPVSDQERAKDFYVNKLGMSLTTDSSAIPGMRWIEVAPKGGGASLTLVTWFKSMPPGSLNGLVLTSDDIQADYKAFVAKGVRFEEPPKEQPWGTEAVFSDPDGNRIVLHKA